LRLINDMKAIEEVNESTPQGISIIIKR
jgi:hypothetical protein